MNFNNSEFEIASKRKKNTKSKRNKKGRNTRSWEVLRERGVLSIDSLGDGGIVSGAVGGGEVSAKVLPRIVRRALRRTATFEPKPIDKDRDGRVQEGTQFERPSVLQNRLLEKPKLFVNNTPWGGQRKLIREQKRQTEIFQDWANRGQWANFHREHFDWWTFPIDRGSSAYGNRFTPPQNVLAELKNNKRYLESLRRAARLYLRSMAWNTQTGDWISNPDFDAGQAPLENINRARLFKIARSMQIHELNEEFLSIQRMVQSLRDAGVSVGYENYWDNPKMFSYSSEKPTNPIINQALPNTDLPTGNNSARGSMTAVSAAEINLIKSSSSKKKPRWTQQEIEETQTTAKDIEGGPKLTGKMSGGNSIFEEMLNDSSEPLNSELEEFVDSDSPLGIPIIRHPLLIWIGPIVPGIINRQYAQKLESVARAKKDKNWSSYIYMHERPYRLDAFSEIQDQMSDIEYWTSLGDIWIDSENLWQNKEQWDSFLSSKRPGRENMMNENERMDLSQLPNSLSIFRGFIEDQNENGLSWTTDKEKAKWFSTRFAKTGDKPVVAKATVKKDDVVAYFTRRGESEIVLSRPPKKMSFENGKVVGRMGLSYTPKVFSAIDGGTQRFEIIDEPQFRRVYDEMDKASQEIIRKAVALKKKQDGGQIKNPESFYKVMMRNTNAPSFDWEDDYSRVAYAELLAAARPWGGGLRDYSPTKSDRDNSRSGTDKKIYRSLEPLFTQLFGWVGAKQKNYPAIYDLNGALTQNASTPKNEGVNTANLIQQMLAVVDRYTNPTNYVQAFEQWLRNPLITKRTKDGKYIGVRLFFNNDRQKLLQEFDERIAFFKQKLSEMTGEPLEKFSRELTPEMQTQKYIDETGDPIRKKIISELEKVLDSNQGKRATNIAQLAEIVANRLLINEGLNEREKGFGPAALLKLLQSEQYTALLANIMRSRPELSRPTPFDDIPADILDQAREAVELVMAEAAVNNQDTLDWNLLRSLVDNSISDELIDGLIIERRTA